MPVLAVRCAVRRAVKQVTTNDDNECDTIGCIDSKTAEVCVMFPKLVKVHPHGPESAYMHIYMADEYCTDLQNSRLTYLCGSEARAINETTSLFLASKQIRADNGLPLSEATVYDALLAETMCMACADSYREKVGIPLYPSDFAPARRVREGSESEPVAEAVAEAESEKIYSEKEL